MLMSPRSQFAQISHMNGPPEIPNAFNSVNKVVVPERELDVSNTPDCGSEF